MPWIQLKIQCPLEVDQVEHLSDRLLEAGAVSMSAVFSEEESLVESSPIESPFSSAQQWIILLPLEVSIDSILKIIQETISYTPPFSHTVLEDQAWELVCRKDAKPIYIAQKLWICPTWDSVPDPDAMIVSIDPGLAFGSGSHASTQLCLRWLAAQMLHNKEVIDYGCGSGILSIAAAKLGARKIWAVDNDDQATHTTQANAIQNQVAHKIYPLLSPPEGIQVDIIIANIVTNTLLELASSIATLIKPQGHILLSGILLSQAETLIHKYQQWFKMRLYENLEGWVCLEGERHAN